MADKNSSVRKLLAAQYALKETVLDQISDLQLAIREEKDEVTRNQLKKKQGELVFKFRDLQNDAIAIIAAETEGDIDLINRLSEDVKTFVHNTKKVAKTIRVVTALIVFVGACVGKEPKTIKDAGAALYKAMNEVIDKDGGKGNAVEATLVPFAIPKSIAHLVPALKSKAKAATKPAAKKPGKAR
ncbi:hypothetical protein H8F21_14865 [Pseudomonas sp. P66]|uniref:Uncharacterized protein n=1 Tax=Pseudomonas arcuscaelestis TaxID=2710591 RepID=A0ABS2BZ01_9PSED|nr:hypothetical protein [Pseudomonas arcuscaelestis]MBM5458848.1 hypothetical protein [Pseudomonas arcuscaelestis]